MALAIKLKPRQTRRRSVLGSYEFFDRECYSEYTFFLSQSPMPAFTITVRHNENRPKTTGHSFSYDPNSEASETAAWRKAVAKLEELQTNETDRYQIVVYDITRTKGIAKERIQGTLRELLEP